MRERNCKICGRLFKPKYNDGLKIKYVICSKGCLVINRSRPRNKYTQEQEDEIITLKKQKKTNSYIVEKTDTTLDFVKKTIKKHGLFLTPEERQENAYISKINKNPECMGNMRNMRIHCETNIFNKKIQKAKEILQDTTNKYSIPHIAKKIELNAGSLRRGLHLRGLSELVGVHSSSGEDEIYDFIVNILPEHTEVIRGNRKLLKGKEVDILIPSINLAIEYCGLYWHTEDSPQPRDRKYHKDKMVNCKKEGIRPVTIFEDEWRDRQCQVKNFIKSVVGVIDKRIYARDCKIEKLDMHLSNCFLDENHIQGHTRFKISIGMYLNNNLVGVLTANKHHRLNRNNEIVLNRLAFADGVQVVGGASRLLKYLIIYCKENNYDKVISWSDSRWSEGNVYSKLNFNLEEELEPDYSYYVGSNKRKPKQSCKKQDLIKLGATGNTESELATSIGYSKIYDCGKKRWVLYL